MSKHIIDNLYLGKLVFLSPIGDLMVKKMSKQEKYKYNKLHDTIVNGAIDLGRNFWGVEYTDYNKRLNYNSVFTIFYKLDDGYYCLHNGNIYQTNTIDNDFVENLTPLKNCLPILGYDIKYNFSTKEALEIFDILFKYNNKEIKYNKNKYDLDNFYFGTLDLCTGYQIISDKLKQDERYILKNIPEKLILQKDKGVSCNFEYLKMSYASDLLEMEYDYKVYNTLLYQLESDEFYNVNNFQIYKMGSNTMKDSYLDVVNNLVLFKDNLKEKDIEYNKSSITIPKVLKLQKIINNNK